MATVTGGSGDDTLNGTSGNDTIVGADGADSITAGAGDDSILGNDGLESADGGDTIDAGDGADDVQGDGGDDSILGGAGADSLVGDAGADTIDGGDDNDTILGGDGNDVLIGGDGNDLIYAQNDDDTIVGGAGDDTIYGHSGADVFVVTANSGTDSIEDYSAGDGDLIAIKYPGITSFTDLQPYLSDDGNFGTLISLPDGSVTNVKWLDYGTISAANFTFDPTIICFLRGTQIETPDGPRPVETLRSGDLVLTLDRGPRPVVHLSMSSVRFQPGPHKQKPIRLKPHALGCGSPETELLVSPQHRIAFPQERPERLVRARKLLALPGVSERPSCRHAQYCHLLLATHELVRANGAWVETLFVSGTSLSRPHVPHAFLKSEMILARPEASKAEAHAFIAHLGGRFRPTGRPTWPGVGSRSLR